MEGTERRTGRTRVSASVARSVGGWERWWKGGGIAASIRRAIISVLGGYGSITVRMVATIDAHFERLSSHSA